MFKKLLDLFKKTDEVASLPREVLTDISMRKEQQEIIDFIQRNSASKTIGIEAPPGIGKTIAYLQYASKWPGKVVISTFTKNLQHQLESEINKFFPNMSYLVLKGRNNYICQDKLALLDEHERQMLIATKPPLNIMEKVKVTPYYCRPQYECQYRSSCEYMNLIEQAQKVKVVIINHFMLRSISRFQDALLIVDECHKLTDTLKQTVKIPEEAMNLPSEPDPKRYGSPRQYNQAVEKFLTLKEINSLAQKHGINKPGEYEIPLKLDFSQVSKVIYASATFPYDIDVDDMFTLRDKRNWEQVNVEVLNINYRQPNYNNILLKTIQSAVRIYGRVLVLCTSHEQIKFIKRSIPETVAEYEMNIYQLRDKMLNNEISIVAGCNRVWQGFDLPGRKCIVMTKLPFPNASDCPDYQVSINKMLFEFKQGLGRMIRTPECSGKIVILDNRLTKYPDLVEILKEKEKLGARVTIVSSKVKTKKADVSTLSV